MNRTITKTFTMLVVGSTCLGSACSVDYSGLVVMDPETLETGGLHPQQDATQADDASPDLNGQDSGMFQATVADGGQKESGTGDANLETQVDFDPELDAAPKLEAAPCSPAAPPEDMFADFEGGQVTSSAIDDRPASDRRLVDDGSGGTHNTMVAAGGPCAASKHFARYSGSGFTSWGSLVSFDFRGNVNTFYDASRYKGIEFYARATAPLKVLLKFPDYNTSRHSPVCSGGACDSHWNSDVMVDTTWKRYYVAFADLRRGANVTAGSFLVDQVSGIEFLTSKSFVFDLSLDDIAFVK